MDYTAVLASLDFTTTEVAIASAAGAIVGMMAIIIGWRFFRKGVGA